MMVSVLAAVLEFQRDMISENTREGVAAAEAAGKTLGRPAALDPSTATASWRPYRQGAAVKALARQHRVAPKAIRRVLDAAGARDLPGPCDMAPIRPRPLDDALTPQVDVVLDVPGRLADLLRIAGDEVVRLALVSGRIIRRGPGYSVRLVAPLALHRAVLEQSAAAADSAGPAERKAHRVYAAQVAAVETTRLHGS